MHVASEADVAELSQKHVSCAEHAVVDVTSVFNLYTPVLSSRKHPGGCADELMTPPQVAAAVISAVLAVYAMLPYCFCIKAHDKL